jgi:hypothetical protein
MCAERTVPMRREPLLEKWATFLRRWRYSGDHHSGNGAKEGGGRRKVNAALWAFAGEDLLRGDFAAEVLEFFGGGFFAGLAEFGGAGFEALGDGFAGAVAAFNQFFLGGAGEFGPFALDLGPGAFGLGGFQGARGEAVEFGLQGRGQGGGTFAEGFQRKPIDAEDERGDGGDGDELLQATQEEGKNEQGDGDTYAGRDTRGEPGGQFLQQGKGSKVDRHGSRLS